MNLQDHDLYESLGELEWKAFQELRDVSDFIYKAPRLLTHEKALEQRKLEIYFPNGGVTADIRKHYEFTKLNETFPRLIAMGNLFLVLSVFENYVLLLLKTLHEYNTNVSPHDSRRGIVAHLMATKAYGVVPHNAKYYEQLHAAISIRNCLMHANGLLSAIGSADANALRNLVSRRGFLSPDIRKKNSKRSQSLDTYVAIEVSELGDRLVITNTYSHLMCFYLSEYFRALCGMLNPNTALRPVTFEIDPKDLALE